MRCGTLISWRCSRDSAAVNREAGLPGEVTPGGDLTMAVEHALEGAP
jgi:hypothetical protein